MGNNDEKKIETKVCKKCQTEIPKKAKRCPQCRAKQPSIVRKIVFILVVALIVFGCVNATKNKTDEGPYKVGQTATIKNLSVKFISANEYKSDNMFLQPADGKVYYKLTFEIENIGDGSETISSMLGWELYADTYSCDQTWGFDDDLSGTISAGKKIKGSVYYEVPKNASKISLEFHENPYLDDKLVFTVK